MFLLGLTLGLFVGASIGFIGCSLLIAAKETEESA